MSVAFNQHAGSIEALLYVSGESLSHRKIKELLDISEEELRESLKALSERYQSDISGLMLIDHAEMVEIVTKPSLSKLIENFTKSFLQENLSKAALEVLAIIAYRGPVTRATLESIRGVNCSFTLRNLLIRGLITREENPQDTREYMYIASVALFEKLGLASQEQLPDFLVLSQDTRLKEVPQTENQFSKEEGSIT